MVHNELEEELFGENDLKDLGLPKEKMEELDDIFAELDKKFPK